MNQEIRAYLRLEATVAATFNFFINGMVSALIYHKADSVPFDAVSIAIDLLLTCFFIFTVTVFFCRASLRRTKTYGILKNDTIAMHYLSRLFNYPVLFIWCFTGNFHGNAIICSDSPSFCFTTYR